VKKWGLALGAGGIFGFAHLGVLQVMHQHDLKPNFIAGTSAGAIIAGLYALGVDLKVIEDEAAAAVLQTDALYTASLTYSQNISSMAFSGLIGGHLIEEALDRLCGGRRLRDAEIPLAIISVDLISGEIVVFTNRDPDLGTLAHPGRSYVGDAKVSEAIRASISIPGIFVPKKFNGRELVDGGVRDAVPAYEVRRMGAEEVVAVDLGWHVDRPQKVAGVYSIVTRSFHLASRDTVVRNLKNYASVVLRPEVGDIGFPTLSKIRALINKGKVCAEKNMDRWLAIVS